MTYATTLYALTSSTLNSIQTAIRNIIDTRVNLSYITGLLTSAVGG